LETNTPQILAGLIGIVAYAFVIFGILKSKAEQSFAAFLLWAMLDGIACITTLMEGGNFWLPLSNTIGSSVITILLIFKKQVFWSWIESMTAVLVAICLAVWFTAGETAGILASSIAVVLASIPQMIETHHKPSALPKAAYFIFLTGNILSFFAGNDWSLKERFYPACSIFLTGVILGLAFRKSV
jgi:hypothetical protein